MFTLANKYSFIANPEMCWLWAGWGYDDGALTWRLHLQSQTKKVLLGEQTEDASFGISVKPPLGLQDWQELHKHPVQMSDGSPSGLFHFQFGCYGGWEDLFHLDLCFNEIGDGKVEVSAAGEGSVEAVPDIFPAASVEFQIRAFATFRGVAINVPLNVSDPLGFSETRIKTLLPRYSFAPPLLRQTKDDQGVVRAVEVAFAPRISEN